MIYEFTPTQDLHGYDKPWAPGAGVNQWDEEWQLGYITAASGGEIQPSQNSICSPNYIPVVQLEEYCLVRPTYNENFYLFFYDEDKVFLPNSMPVGNVSYRMFTVPQAAKFMRFSCNNYYSTFGAYRHDISINYPATVKTYSPYANICPLEGYNIWDPTNDEFIQVYAGYVNANTRELHLRPVYEEYAGEELVGPWMSSLDPYAEDTTPTEGAFVIDFGGELESYEITPFMLQTLLDSLGIRQHFTNGAGLLNSLMDQAQGRVRSEEELLNRSLPLHVIAIGEDLPTNLVIKKPVSDVLPGLPGKTKI